MPFIEGEKKMSICEFEFSCTHNCLMSDPSSSCFSAAIKDFLQKKKGFCPFFFHKQFCNLPCHCDLHIRYDKIMLLKRGKTIFVFLSSYRLKKKIFYLSYFIFYTKHIFTEKLYNILVFHNISGMHIQY